MLVSLESVRYFEGFDGRMEGLQKEILEIRRTEEIAAIQRRKKMMWHVTWF